MQLSNPLPPMMRSALLQRLRRMDRAVLALLAALALLAWLAPSMWWPSVGFVARNLLTLAPVLALSIALAAGIRAAGAEALVARAFAGRESSAIMIAALAGALSPLCSCGVVPLIAGLLAGGVPLAPVMAFWLASPVMDPAMFVLTTGVIDLEFAFAKTAAAVLIGLFGGLATRTLFGGGPIPQALRPQRAVTAAAGPQAWAARRLAPQARFWQDSTRRALFASTAIAQLRLLLPLMAFAFLLESLMLAWMPPQAFAKWLGGEQIWAIPLAALIGVPAYLNGTAAVPLIGGMLDLGLDRAVGLTFLVAGGVTSVPAAMAVWALVRPPVFALYLVLAISGAVLTGFALAAWQALA